MTGRTQVELALDRYLADGADRVPDRVIDAALDLIDDTPQRRVVRLPWRTPDVPAYLKPALAGAAIAAILVLGGLLLNGGSMPGVGREPTPPPSSTSGQDSASGDPQMTETFRSALHRYSVRYPAGWAVEPATEFWSPPDWSDGTAPFDKIYSGTEELLFRAASAAMPDQVLAADATIDDWIERHVTMSDIPTCAPPRETLEQVVIDGYPGRLRDSCDEVEATVVAQGRVYVFTVFVLAGDEADDEVAAVTGHRPLFEAFASTIRLTPETAATSDWSRFDSERYGYSISYPSDWTAIPAAADWAFEDRDIWENPAKDQFVDLPASYPIQVHAWAADVPAGMSEDEWVAAYFDQGPQQPGCGTLSDDVRAITVGGRPARLVNEQPCSDTMAFVFIDGRVNVFAIGRANQEVLFEAFLSTVAFDR